MIGIDMVKIERIEGLIDRFGQKGLKRFMNPQEMESFIKPRSIAGIWAAKEAIAKALGTGIGKELAFHDIVIRKDPKGAPLATLEPSKMERFGVRQIAISITHDGGFAIAVAFLERSSSSSKS